MNTYFALRAKLWLRGGVGGQLPWNLNCFQVAWTSSSEPQEQSVGWGKTYGGKIFNLTFTVILPTLLIACESPGTPGPLLTGQMNLKSYLPGRKSTHPRLLDRSFLSPVKVTVFYKLAGSAALLDQSALTILAQTIQKSHYFYQTKWWWAPTSLSTFILFFRSAALHKRYPISELLKSLSVRRSRPTTDGNPPLQDTKWISLLL